MNTVLVGKRFPSNQTLQIVQGDITTEDVDAIVNAANEHLQHGGGVAWAISKKGRPAIQKESDQWIREHGPVSHSHPAWTSGGNLPAKYVIHAVGPIWFNGSEDEDLKLEQAVTGSLRTADELKCESIGTRIVSLSGHVRRPGYYEVEVGKVTLGELIFDPAFGGGLREGRQLKAIIPGGASAKVFKAGERFKLQRRGLDGRVTELDVEVSSISRTTSTPSSRPGACLAPGPLSFWTIPPTWSRPWPTSPSSTPMKAAASAPPVAKARSG